MLQDYYSIVEIKLIMSVEELAHRLTYQPNEWRIIHYGPIRHMVANRYGAKLKYVLPDTGQTITKNFVRNSYVVHVRNTNTLSYVENDVIPFVEAVAEAV